MIFLDRLTGNKFSRLPEALLPGRYCLLEPLVVNGHSCLQPGDLLADDGSGILRVQDTESRMLAIDQSDDDQAVSDLSAEAIISIAGKIAHAHGANVSPLLPSEMADQCALEELERDLAVVLKMVICIQYQTAPAETFDMTTWLRQWRELDGSRLQH